MISLDVDELKLASIEERLRTQQSQRQHRSARTRRLIVRQSISSGDESSRSLHIEASQLRTSSAEIRTPQLPMLKARYAPELKPEYDMSATPEQRNASVLDKLLKRLR